MTIGSVTITPIAASNSTGMSNANDNLRHAKDQKDGKHKDKSQRDRDRDRDRERVHGERNIDRLTGKEERIRRDSGGYMGGHYSGGRDDDHWMSSREGRDIRDGRY